MRGDAAKEYLRGALWVYPMAAVVVSLVAGSLLSSIEVPSDSWLDPLLFQGTADDARTLLIGISGTMMSVITLVLGLTLVALQLSSTQFSPRLLRNFLRDRTNQRVLGVFVLTFVYSTAGLYTVGVDQGQRVDEYPRLAVTLAILLLFASLMVLVYFVHHVSHSIQIDAVMSRVERTTLQVIEHDLPQNDIVHGKDAIPPAWAVAVPSYASGYVQTVHPEPLLAAAVHQHACVSITPMVGEHVIAGGALAWVWHPTPEERAPDVPEFVRAAHDSVRIGFERTAEQDAAFGMRQLADIAVKALSPAINDPYTGIQALEHIGVLLAALARRELGSQEVRDADGSLRVVVRGRDLAYYVELATGQVRRYGRHEPRVLRALLRVLDTTGRFCRPEDRPTIAHHVQLVLEAGERAVVQAADLAPVLEHGRQVLERLGSPAPTDEADPLAAT
jgi:uncharacterized membrane protein